MLKHNVRFWLLRLTVAGFVGVASGSGLTQPGLAQNAIIPDATLGSEASQVVPFAPLPIIELIQGGAVRGQNLFHSFEQFSIGEGNGAYFITPSSDIANVFTRITGSDHSQILGILGARQADFSLSPANLFLINPNGILFGENSQLDLGGSFLATTANAMLFSNSNDVFSTSNPNVPSSLLSVSPSALLFEHLQNNAAISNLSRSPAGFNLSGAPLFGLRVPDGESLVLLGGDIRIDGGGLVSLGGRVEAGGLNNSGVIEIFTDQDGFRSSFSDSDLKAEVILDNSAGIYVMAQGGGEIVINAGNLNIFGGSTIYAGIGSGLGDSNTQAGDISISVDGDIIMRGPSSLMYNYIDTNASGLGGNVTVHTGQLFLEDNAQLGALVFGDGIAGDVKIFASGVVSLDGNIRESETRGFPSAINNRLLTNGTGSSGNIEIESETLSITNRAQIASTTEGKGSAGNIIITVQDKVFLLNSIIISEVTEEEGIGDGGDITITAGFLDLVDGSALLADTENIGNAGSIFINSRDGVFLRGFGPSALDTRVTVPSQISTTVEQQAIGEGGDIIIETSLLNLTDDAFISTSTFGQGSAGNISIQASSVNITEGATLNALTTSIENSGDISVYASEMVSINGQGNSRTGITTASLGDAQGNGGNISIMTPSLSVVDQGRISALSERTGRAGDIELTIENFQLTDSVITTSAFQSSGGNIRLNSANSSPSGITILRGSGDITTSSFGDGGNIFLNSIVIAFDDSDILARSSDARGGNITLGPFFSSTLPIGAEFPTENNDRVDVSADGQLASGTITTPDTSFIQNSLNQLPVAVTDTSTLIAGSCIARTAEGQGTFVNTGSGGLPIRPGDGVISSYPTGSVQPLPSSEPQAVWQQGDPIVEPTGVFSLPNGRLVLARACDDN